MAEPVLAIRGLSKTFPGQRALKDASFEVLPGEVHGLVGENGSGKSTLIKCLAGYHEPDPGAEIVLGGRRLSVPYQPAFANEVGLAFIHQDLGLIPTLTVAENIALTHGFVTGTGRRIRWRTVRREAKSLLEDFGVDISPDELVGHLPLAAQTLVAIVRALADAREGRVLVLDEPTSALPAPEVQRLLEAVQRIAASGIGVIYVSHRLGEVLGLAGRVTVLRDGAIVDTVTTDGLTESSLVELIIGRTLEQQYPKTHSIASGEVRLRLNGVTGSRVHDVSLALRGGEVLGIAGLLGSGRSELARLVTGAQTIMRGSMELSGASVTFQSPADAISAGVVLVPEDRLRHGGFPKLSVRENVTLPSLSAYFQHGRLNRSLERSDVARLMDAFDVRPPDPSRIFSTLSGGNQQKAILAKWMHVKPGVLVLDEPVQGVDVGAKREIYELIERVAANGAGVLLVDSDFEDLCQLCDRVLLMRSGRIVGEVEGADMTRHELLRLAYLNAEVEAA